MKKLSDILCRPAVYAEFSDDDELIGENELKRVRPEDISNVVTQALGSPESDPDPADALRKIWSGAGHF